MISHSGLLGNYFQLKIKQILFILITLTTEKFKYRLTFSHNSRREEKGLQKDTCVDDEVE